MNCVTGMVAALEMEPVRVMLVIMATRVNYWKTVTRMNFTKPLMVITTLMSPFFGIYSSMFFFCRLLIVQRKFFDQFSLDIDKWRRVV